tara:strand:- start:514 stop:678 length:165 start_codon:yes stop_codon:yes gene_type:complete
MLSGARISMTEKPIGLFPWAILIFALVVPNPWKLASERAFAEQSVTTEQCSIRQ